MIFQRSKAPFASPKSSNSNKGKLLIAIALISLTAALILFTTVGPGARNSGLVDYSSAKFSIKIPKGFTMVGLKANSTVFMKTDESNNKVDGEILTVGRYLKTNDPTNSLNATEAQNTKTPTGGKVVGVQSKYVTIGKVQALMVSSSNSTSFFVPASGYIWRVSAEFEKEGALSSSIETIAKSLQVPQ